MLSIGSKITAKKALLLLIFFGVLFLQIKLHISLNQKVLSETNTSFVIKKGETIKFEVINAGELVHEFNIANAMMHKKHRPEMERMVENEILLADSIDREKMKKMAKMDKAMGHSHSNSVLLAPKEKGDLVWKFDNAMNIEIACNVPGHYEIGMIAKVQLD